ncbi:MAG: aspartate carbamoyltransferase catalytic subunit [Acidobacteria bacterium]|nr:aspartate carbamoyltransferase catalytic subunit [Acidobacteriota bacterium]MCH8985380.1 aspartate carbamoyltransferase catalytic subunit [Acidobacteriota bacterium]
MLANLLSTEEMERHVAESLLDDADGFLEVLARPIPKVPTLRGKTVATLFFEPSTRTRMSFERAAKALSADTLSFSLASSSVSKGESLKDTVLTVQAMGADLAVVRHKAIGAPWRVAEWTGMPVVNGGDGAHQHPTQALLDALTIRHALGSLDGVHVGIIGDIRHSRVARSNCFLFSTLGADVTLIAPPTLLPVDATDWPVTLTSDLDAQLGSLDVVYLLRIQTERGGASVFPSLSEYVRRFGLTQRRFEMLTDRAIVLHPGPMNRGAELADVVADDPRCLVLDQVANGVAVRMAVLYQLLGGSRG